ncbi:MAG TPA: 1-(5-phosphoribosyl)-5-[(5-phosphoribosylamino)methylideneamino]imidazole-4-carboxamide isomerase [Flavitalea sp.]|nr:1-(5-phosphoribosyl)-5-[(5-phosphoribosylamino)methylideneamino]imidazole-4-carboxamide isomerase [Flavitalea sp.]
MNIIPAIDIIEGKCVRLSKGDFTTKKIYNEKPVEVALQFEDAGLKRLHLVDLDGARSGKVCNWKVLESIAAKTSLVIDFGGGIKTREDVSIIFNSGGSMAAVGSIAVKNEKVFTGWLEEFGTDKFFLGADVKEEKIAISGWAETTSIWIYDFIGNYFEKGIREVFCTDVSRDGLLEGPATELYKNLHEKFPGLDLVASGGVGKLTDIDDIRNAGCKGVIIGKAIYEGRISLSELSRYMHSSIQS